MNQRLIFISLYTISKIYLSLLNEILTAFLQMITNPDELKYKREHSLQNGDIYKVGQRI